ncbi:MAG: hypothetical protein KUG72_04980 [Pseudomonadales bacterium]|nr:hypothetical protein [Pseudomonadales bacterium]
MEGRALNICRIFKHIQNKVGLALMEYAFYFVLSALIIGVTLYLVRQRVKRINNKRRSPVETTPSSDYPLDDFICIMLRDGTCRPGFISGEKSSP